MVSDLMIREAKHKSPAGKIAAGLFFKTHWVYILHGDTSERRSFGQGVSICATLSARLVSAVSSDQNHQPPAMESAYMKLLLLFVVIVTALGMGAGLEAAEIYQWVDEDGVQHFTDGPPPPGAQIVEGLSETQADEPPAHTGATDDEKTGDVAPDGSGVTDGEASGVFQPDDSAPSDIEDSGAVEGDENSTIDREDYWRRRGWGNGSTGAGGPEAAEGGQNSSPDGEDTGVPEDDEYAPSE